jgi:hypothetical protein
MIMNSESRTCFRCLGLATFWRLLPCCSPSRAVAMSRGLSCRQAKRCDRRRSFCSMSNLLRPLGADGATVAALRTTNRATRRSPNHRRGECEALSVTPPARVRGERLPPCRPPGRSAPSPIRAASSPVANSLPISHAKPAACSPFPSSAGSFDHPGAKSRPTRCSATAQ